MRRLCRIALALLASATAVLAQPSKLSETVNVHLVEVPVTVVDRAGNPVRGLTAANFEIVDQGKAREITAFDAVDFASADSMRKSSPLNPAARRNFLLLFDMSFSSPVGRSRAQDAARAFVAKTLTRRDLAAVATIDIDHGFRLLTSFTTDRTALVQAIGNPQTFLSGDPLQIGSSDVFATVVPQAFSPEGPSSGGREAAVLDTVKDIARLERRLNDNYKRTRVEKELTMLGGLARTLRIVPGQKQVIFFSEGFDAALVQGRDAHMSPEVVEEMEQSTGGEYWKIDFDQRFGSSTSLTILDRMARFFRGSDVILHSIDIQGLRVQNDLQTGAKLNSNEGLHLVSRATGGSLFQHSNDIGADLDKLMRRQEVVYVLGFRAASQTAGKFHDLKVRVKGVPGASVTHRAGYYEGGSENAIERTLTNAEVIMNDIPENEVRIATLVAPLPGKSSGQVPVIVEINGQDLVKGAKSSSVSADLYVYAFDEDGVVRDRVFQRLAVDTTKTAGQLESGGVKYYATLSLPPGRYAIKSLVRLPETERKGFVRTDIVVPGIDDVAVLPPMFFDRPGQWLLVKGATHGESGPYPFQINGEPFMPSAVARLRNGEPKQFIVFVYNATADEMSWEATLTDPAGTRAAAPTLVKQLQGDFVTKMLFQYDARGAAPGNATLDILIRKKGSSDIRRASVPLFVTN